jgi:hypothetical protein
MIISSAHLCNLFLLLFAVAALRRFPSAVFVLPVVSILHRGCPLARARSLHVFVSALMVRCAVLPPVQISVAKRVTGSHQPVHLRAIHILLVTARQVPLLIFPAARRTKHGTGA